MSARRRYFENVAAYAAALREDRLDREPGEILVHTTSGEQLYSIRQTAYLLVRKPNDPENVVVRAAARREGVEL